jgi:hypothetical protein
VIFVANSVETRIDAWEKRGVSSAMIEYGGNFVSLLGHALRRADPENTLRIREAFPEYWDKYYNVYQKDAPKREPRG